MELLCPALEVSQPLVALEDAPVIQGGQLGQPLTGLASGSEDALVLHEGQLVQPQAGMASSSVDELVVNADGTMQLPKRLGRQQR